MKTLLIASGVALAAISIATAQSPTNSRTAAVSGVTNPGTNEVLGVEKFMRGVAHYQGRVLVKGVVRKVSANTQALALIDVQEFEKCGLADCADLVLPVRWTGTMPGVGQRVRISGEVQKKKGKMVFVAGEIEKVQLAEKKK